MKPQILLLHGALGSKYQLQSINEKLQQTHEVLDMNFEGHGGRQSDREFSMNHFSENVIDFLNFNALDSVDIFGYSMGGYVALNAALKHPDRIKSIVTLGTKFDWSQDAAEKEVKMLNPDIVEEKVPRFAEMLKLTHAPLDWKEVMTKTADMMLGMADGAKLDDDDFTRISIPVTIGVGTLDKMVSVQESENVASLLPNSNFVVLEGVEHPVEKVDPEVVKNLVAGNYS